HQSLALAGAHLRDLALVQHHAAYQLHVVVAQSDHAQAGFTNDGKGFGQDLVEALAIGDALLELGGLVAQGDVVELLHLGFERVDARHDFRKLLQHAFVAAAEDTRQDIGHRTGFAIPGYGGRSIGHDKSTCRSRLELAAKSADFKNPDTERLLSQSAHGWAF